MIFLRAILFAVWNGLNIKWKLRGTGSDEWHTVGWWYRAVFALVVVSQFMPEWFQYIVNPAFMFDWWYGIPITLLTLLVLDYWLYNAIINWSMQWKWNYLGKHRYGGFWYTGGLVVCIFLTLILTAFAIISKYYPNFINT